MNVIRDFQPTHIVHLAGVSAPIEAERDPERAWALHVDVPRHLSSYGAWMLYPSSDFVWDGTKKGRYTTADVPHPNSVYGRSKVAGERAVDGLVVRFSLLFGPPACPRRTTWTQWTSKLDSGESVPVYTNEFRTPVSLTEAAHRVIDLGVHNVRGLVHVAGPDVLAPKDLVTVLARARGTPARTQPAAVPRGVTRPRNMAMAPTVMFGVVIPAYHGAGSLHRSMISVASQTFSDRLKVVVAVNDGLSETYETAHRLRPAIESAGAECVVVRSPSGRANAFAAAEAELPEGPRLYLDQDAVLSRDVLTELARLLRPGGKIHFAAPQVRAVRPRSVATRAFYRTWQELPYVRDSPVTMGAYAVSAEGRQRWDQFPELHSDDKWVRWQFAPSERAVLRHGSYEVVLPEGVRELVRARRRYQRGNRQLNALDLAHRDDSARHRGAVRSLAGNLPSSAVFLGVYSAAAVLDRCTG